jgi:hypothetical protein
MQLVERAQVRVQGRVLLLYCFALLVLAVVALGACLQTAAHCHDTRSSACSKQATADANCSGRCCPAAIGQRIGCRCRL